MAESVLVYFSLAFVMIVCGSIVANRQVQKDNGGVEVHSSLELFRIEWWLPVIAFSVVFGCRHNVGVDYPHYLDMYLYDAEGYYRENVEFLFATPMRLMSRAGVHFAFFFTLWAFIEITLIYYAFRNYRYLFPYIAFFLIFGFYFLSMMNVIRQQLATCVFMVSIQYVVEKKPLKYYLCVLVATLFHKSSLLLIFIYPLFAKKNDWVYKFKWQFLFYFLAFAISILFYDKLIQMIEVPFVFFTQLMGFDLYQYGVLTNEHLNSASQFGNNTGLGVYVRLFLSLPIIIYSKKMKSFYNSSYFNVIYNLWFIRIISEFLVGDSIILNRPFVFFVNYKMIMLAFFIYFCMKNRQFITSALAVSFVLLHFLLFGNLLSNGEINTSKFTFFWQA